MRLNVERAEAPFSALHRRINSILERVCIFTMLQIVLARHQKFFGRARLSWHWKLADVEMKERHEIIRWNKESQEQTVFYRAVASIYSFLRYLSDLRPRYDLHRLPTQNFPRWNTTSKAVMRIVTSV